MVLPYLNFILFYYYTTSIIFIIKITHFFHGKQAIFSLIV